MDFNFEGEQVTSKIKEIIITAFEAGRRIQVSNGEFEKFNWSCTAIINSTNKDEKMREEEIVESFLLDCRNHWRLFNILSQNCPESTVFVCCEIIAKVLQSDTKQFQHTKELLNQLNIQQNQILLDDKLSPETVSQLQMFGFFIRFLTGNDRVRMFQGYTIRSLCNLLAVLFKSIWIENTLSGISELIEFVTQILEQNEEYGFYIVDYLIQIISNFSNSLGYILYRRTILSFQTAALVPFTEQIAKKLYPLLQQSAQNPMSNQAPLKRIVEVFFSILSFNFNVSYYDFETDQEYQDNQLIQFPEKIIKILVDFDFLKALFFSAKSLIAAELPIGLTVKIKDYQNDLLRCLSRIVSCRSTHSNDEKEKKRMMVMYCCQGISEVIKSLKGFDVETYLEIIDYCNRMMNNFGLKKLRKIEIQGIEWVGLMQEFSLFAIKSTSPHIRDEVVPKIMALWRKIVRLSVNIKIPDTISGPVQKFPSALISAFLEKCLTYPQNFFSEVKFLRYKKFKKAIKNYFDSIFHIANNDLESIFLITTSIQEKQAEEYFLSLQARSLEDLKRSNQKICICMGLMTQLMLVSSVGVDRSSAYLQLSEGVYECMGKSIAIFFKIIESQISYPTEQFEAVSNEMTELSLLYFLEEYVIKTLGTMDTDDVKAFESAPTSTMKVLLFKHEKRNQFMIFEKYFTYTQKYLNVQGFSQLTNLMMGKLEQGISSKSRSVFEYSLQIINFIFIRLKHNLSRAVFKKLPLIERLSQLIMKESVGRQLPSDALKIRAKIYELVAFVYMDDPFDNFIDATDEIVKRISFNPQTCQKNDMIRFFYDACGLARHIDVGAIYKVFLKKTYHLYKFVFSDLILVYGLETEIMVPALKLMLSIIDNKTQRITILSNQSYGYQMFKDFSPFLLKYGQLLLEYFKSQKDQLLQQNNKIKLVLLYWRVLQKFISSRLVNFSVFSLFNDHTFNEYLKICLDLKFLLFECVFSYPKLASVFIQNIQCISDQFLETVFSLPGQKYSINLFLISKRFMEKILQEQFNYAHSANIHEDTLLQSVSTVVSNLCSFCIEEINFKMTEELEQGVKRAIEGGQIIFKEYTAFLFQASFKYPQNSLFSKISNPLLSFIVFSPLIFEEVQKEYLQSTARSQDELRFLSSLLKGLLQDVQLKLDPINNEKFQNNLKMTVKIINNRLETPLIQSHPSSIC